MQITANTHPGKVDIPERYMQLYNVCNAIDGNVPRVA